MPYFGTPSRAYAKEKVNYQYSLTRLLVGQIDQETSEVCAYYGDTLEC